jgi:SAM-dependent methyltransferase
MKYVKLAGQLMASLLKSPGTFMRILNMVPAMCHARDYANTFKNRDREVTGDFIPQDPNPLWEYFKQNTKGSGIWKWNHYFDVYHRHFQKFIGKKSSILEVGVFSGGSLGMWKNYFGPECQVYGMDIEPACKVYEKIGAKIFIGDQESRAAWSAIKKELPELDMLIDDGGHTVEQMMVTCEEMLPFLRPGGVFICEDIHGNYNKFAAFAGSLVQELNLVEKPCPAFQSAVYSVHFYPFQVVFEKHGPPVSGLPPCKNGTEWQPFFDWMPTAPTKQG